MFRAIASRRSRGAARAFLLCGALWALSAPCAALAQDARGPVRLLVGYPPGGPADTAARIVAEKLTQALGRTVLVDNRPGAGGQIAAQALKVAPADGSVLLLSNTHTVATIPLTVRNAGFSPATDFRPVGTIATFELALAVHPKTGATNLAGLGAWFARHPGETGIGVPAAGSAPEFVAGKISKALKADTVPVPYRGAAPLVQDLLGAQVAAGISGVSDFLPYHQNGKLRIIAVSNPTPLLPGVPSFAQAGIAGLALTDFLGLYAPAATPDAIVVRYNATLNRVLAMPEIGEKLREHVMLPAPGTPAEQAQRLAQVSTALAGVVRESGYRPQ
ncbi:tripartite tricarboxylate transporter substrate-binding protein [Cupriavidus basilensis]|uniref:Tripartite tricarboxylate transporter substrate-binding protein n=1 Tax=Cupriavidus basilensis TaxID=68895 RepID=A0ABT6AGB0_9BURK|nr:tripartite tricarboxylate transporter substrate-binding protein [Cupriavidus basilensis]MDF3831634.1 tripartite tricarboxylate transporter substrate-binding protein [Cupriavidus basilensis]